MVEVSKFTIPTRRRYQHGSLALRGKNRKVWIGRYREDVIYGDNLVRRVLRKVTLGTLEELPTKRLAQRELDRRLSKINGARTPTSFTPFNTLAERWQENLMVQHKPSSQSCERAHIKKWLVPAFGEASLLYITPEILQKFISSLTLNPKTIRNIFATFRMIWKTAKRWGYVDSDITLEIMLPKSVPPNRPCLRLEEANALIELADEPFKTMFWVLAETGIRGGELCALYVEDVDLENGRLFIRRSAWRGQLQTPKTKNALRKIPLSNQLAEHLSTYIANHGNQTGLLFPTRAGTPFDNLNIVKREFQPLLEKLGIQKCGLHALRHMSATMMDVLNVPLNIRQSRMGHSTALLTLDRYTHAVPAEEKVAAQKLGTLLRPKLANGSNAPSEQTGRGFLLISSTCHVPKLPES